MEENQTVCPCCGRHCNLDNPHCERGIEYAKTGVIPSRSHDHRERHEGHYREHHGDRKHFNHKQRYQGLDVDNKLIWNLRDLGHCIRDLSEGKASQSRILSILRGSQPVAQNDLTEQLGVQPGTASEVFGKLEHAGLITRTPSEQDRRTSIITLTPSGLAAAETADEQKRQRHSEMFSSLSEEDKAALLALLEALNHDWHHRYGHGRREGGRHRKG